MHHITIVFIGMLYSECLAYPDDIFLKYVYWAFKTIFRFETKTFEKRGFETDALKMVTKTTRSNISWLYNLQQRYQHWLEDAKAHTVVAANAKYRDNKNFSGLQHTTNNKFKGTPKLQNL